ncbi:tetratricopeptide repeat protein [Atopobium fossor]|uniref:tetratricopeptide repeat protein n=1 Tax=Atopobium fossor TaxID=39487 RepID=UPI0003FA14D1|nr:bacterial transcriptional activator domain-containing protein [Atopobium fossor]
MEHKENGSKPQRTEHTSLQTDAPSNATLSVEFNDAQIDTSFNIYALYRGFNAAPNFIDALKLYYAGVQNRTHMALSDPTNNLMPCAAEQLLARWLEEADLLQELPVADANSDEEPHWPQMRLIMLHHTGMVYLRIEEFPVPYIIKLRIIRIEAALNRMLMAATKTNTHLAAMNEQEIYTYTQAINDTICQQHDVQTTVEKPHNSYINQELPSEWAVRKAIATGFETWILPYRFVGSLRCNVARGAVAIEIELIPPSAMPQSCWSNDLNKVLRGSKYMRNAAASAYALRLGILAASTAFDAHASVQHVWVAGIINTSTARSCRYSVCFTRDTFTTVNTQSLDQLQESYNSFGANIIFDDGWLAPCEQTFFLEDELFCPRERYDSIELSSRILDEKTAELLGSCRVADFGINEYAPMEQLAEQLGMKLGSTVTEQVHALMDFAHTTNHTVQQAAKRTASKLIEGTLDAEDYQAILDEFTYGDNLSRTRQEALGLFMQGKNEETCKLIAGVLKPIEAAHSYESTKELLWCHFETYTERSLFNRAHAADAQNPTVCLVPMAYYSCLLMYASALVRLGQLEQGITYARRCLELNPYDIRARLLLAGALEQGGDQPGALTELIALLHYVYSGDSMGIGLYRLGSLMWKRNQPRVADACYSKALQFSSTAHDMAAFELKALMEEHKDSYEPVQIDDIDSILQENNIPTQVDEKIHESLRVVARTAMDAQLFELASDVMSNLTNLDSDEILFDIDRSIEHAPDK